MQHSLLKGRNMKCDDIVVGTAAQHSEQVYSAAQGGTPTPDIAEERPVSVHKGQHFRSRHKDLSCSGAPVFGVDGALSVSRIIEKQENPCPSKRLQEASDRS